MEMTQTSHPSSVFIYTINTDDWEAFKYGTQLEVSIPNPTTLKEQFLNSFYQAHVLEVHHIAAKSQEFQLTRATTNPKWGFFTGCTELTGEC